MVVPVVPVIVNDGHRRGAAILGAELAKHPEFLKALAIGGVIMIGLFLLVLFVLFIRILRKNYIAEKVNVLKNQENERSIYANRKKIDRERLNEKRKARQYNAYKRALKMLEE